MVRQARSDATRRKIITSAVELFNEIGYPATGLGDIIERAEMTKGALYYHFDSKESLATAIIEEGSANLIPYLPKHHRIVRADARKHDSRRVRGRRHAQ
jgi:AcrR family transcriptional regulator